MGQPDTTDRLDVWRDLIRDHFVALDIAADRRGPFTGSVWSTDVGHVNIASVTSSGQTCTRTRRLARSDDEAYLQVGLVADGTARLAQDGREALLTAGDYAVYETDRPFVWEFEDAWELLVFTWPRSAVPLSDSTSQSLTARRLSGTDGLGAIVGRMLQDVVHNPPSLSPAGGVRLSEEVAELVTTVAAEQAAPTTPPGATTALLRSIDAYIYDRLDDPQLGPQDIAAGHFISTRHLHRLFAGRGTTVNQQVRRLRLERSRLELQQPAYDVYTITEISRRCGFADLPTFSRAFRAAYGIKPTECRATRSR